MKKILLFLIAVGSIQPAIAQKTEKTYSADSMLSRWVLDVNLLGGLSNQNFKTNNTSANYPNALNENTGNMKFMNGYAYGADAQLGFFFGKKRHFGIGTGVLYLRQSGDAALDNFHVEYQSKDFAGSTFRQLVTGNSMIDHLKSTNISIPLMLKYKNRFSEKWGFAMDLGVLFNMQMKNDYSTKANFDYEAIYKFDQNGTPIYDNAPIPSTNDWLITKAEFYRNNKNGNYQEYIAAKRALGYNVGDGVSPTNTKGSVSYNNYSIGFMIQPSFNYFLSDNLALNFGLYYMIQPFMTNNAQSGYRMTDAVGSYNPLLNNVTEVINQSYGINIGARFFLGRAKKAHETVVEPIAPVVVVDQDVRFSVQAPQSVTITRKVKEIFPLRNSVFFDIGSTEIPARYVLLSKSDAGSFREAQLQQGQPDNLNRGRSSRQLVIYYNILNIMGDRMRSNPQTTLVLTGSAERNPKEGKELAENVKQYLVNVYNIDPSRIRTEGRSRPINPSEEPGATKELVLLREEDRKVDIESSSPELLVEVGGANPSFLRPVQIVELQGDPKDRVLFNADGASTVLKSWSVEVKDEQGNIQRFGPYTADGASVAANTILGSSQGGNYTVVMIGETNKGDRVRKQSSMTLTKAAVSDVKQDGLRYSILFDFDKSKTIDAYKDFLTNVVAPLISENATVVIHGHTDIVGGEQYNLTLSQQRAAATQQILERALANAGKRGVKFDVHGFGQDENNAPFENKLPEQRFYNRTVIIDIVPAN